MRRINPYAVASLVCGILWLLWLGSLLAVVFGHLARGQIRRHGDRGYIVATIGLVLGYAGLLALVLSLMWGDVWIAPN